MDVLQIMTKIFEKIKENGWKSVTGLSSEEEAMLILSKGLLKSFIFNHEVAKAFFGNKKLYPSGKDFGICYGACREEMEDKFIYSWEFHLQKLVLEKEQLKYMSKFLKAKNE